MDTGPVHTGTAETGTADSRSGELTFVKVGFGPHALPYLRAWDLQRALHERRVSRDIGDCCLLLEHPPVYTAGKRTTPLDRPLADPGAPVIDVDRGGNITWHGPGQLVGYPIVALGEPIDVKVYVRAIEGALIKACAQFGVAATRIEGRSGAWVRGSGGASGMTEDRKVGAIGIRIARGVTMHGFALNCDCDLAWFDQIVPCGIRDAGVTSLSVEAGREVTVEQATDALLPHLAGALGATSWRVTDSATGLLPLTPAPLA